MSIGAIKKNNSNLNALQSRLLLWENQEPISSRQDEYLNAINEWQARDGKAKEINLPNSSSLTNSNGISVQKNDFLLWYEDIYNKIQVHDDAKFYNDLRQLEHSSESCLNILEELADILQLFTELTEKYFIATEKTVSFSSANKQLIAEEEDCKKISNEIKNRLNYFIQVENIERRLQSSSTSVFSDEFRECLNQIDISLQYLTQHANYKDALTYANKYKRCFVRALTQIKNYAYVIITEAFEMAAKTPKQIDNTSAGNANIDKYCLSEMAYALYYGKYQISAAKLKRLSTLVEERLAQSMEYGKLLNALHEIYFNNRAYIMSPAIRRGLENLKIEHKNDHTTLLRSSCAFLLHVSMDEHRLYLQFFTTTSSSSEQLKIFLIGLNTILFDFMRPIIIHINHLETLAEICSILRIEMSEENTKQNPLALEAFAEVINQLLQDAQERLVFRAHIYFQTDILNYKPSAGDLAYPEKLIMMEDIAMSLKDNACTDGVRRESWHNNSPADMHCMWYPTVRRTLVCLSRLYRCVDRHIFQNLSQEALEVCIQSVLLAAKKISMERSLFDGELFEIKHLLILREQIAPFRMDFTAKETKLDFSNVKTAAYSLLQHRKKLLLMNSNNALLEFLLDGTPQVKERFIDARKDIDRHLKHACEQFIADAENMLLTAILTFIKKLKSATANNSGSNSNKNAFLLESDWAKPEHIKSYIAETYRSLKTKLPVLERTMQLYINSRDTEFIIFRAIRNNIIQSFAELEITLTNSDYNTEDMLIIGCPSAEEISILVSSTSILASETALSLKSLNLNEPKIEETLKSDIDESTESIKNYVDPTSSEVSPTAI